MKSGDKVLINTIDKKLTGIYMPNSTKEKIFIKLDTGYNVGILKKHIKSTKVIKAFKEKKKKLQKHTHKKNKKTISILHTGGTVASKVDYETGGVIAHFTPEDLLEMVPELEKIANIKTELVSEMMSEDMMFTDYQKILKAIKKHSKSDGIILTQGTDTLGYTAAALAFALEEINIPILIVGSQRSSDRGSSDGAMNLICATEYITKSGFTGVAVCMHDSTSDDKCAISPATKTRKMHTSRRDAFRTINDTPIALIDYKTKNIQQIKAIKKGKPIKIANKFENKVGILKTHPNMDPKLFTFYTKNYKAIVLEGTGLGHAPTNLGKDNLKNYKTLKDYIKKGGIVAVTSQCLYGRVHPHVYTNLRRLADIGCIFCEDMLPETAFIKLSWLLGSYPKQAKKLLTKNLKGEINTILNTDFL
tara:strand:+ start:1322 stop:2575 length:1254 start_codon:yes stop_codon:yes gene_type:complete